MKISRGSGDREIETRARAGDSEALGVLAASLSRFCEMVTGQEAASLISLITVKLHNGWLIEADRQRVN